MYFLIGNNKEAGGRFMETHPNREELLFRLYVLERTYDYPARFGHSLDEIEETYERFNPVAIDPRVAVVIKGDIVVPQVLVLAKQLEVL